MDKKTLGVITPTGRRAEALDLCKRWMCEQTILPTKWIVVNDDKSEIDVKRSGDYCYLELPGEGFKPDVNTQAANLLKGIDSCNMELIAIIEDDDFYSATYLEQMLNALGDYDMVGLSETWYYLLTTQSYRQLKNKGYSILAQTLMTKEVAEKILKPLLQLNQTPFDMNLWNIARKRGAKVKIFHPDKPIAIGIKGMPGRGHSGMGADYRDWTKDTDSRKLKELIGKDYKHYIPFMGKGK